MTRAASPFLRRAIAFHESAHAVVGRHLGLVVTAATIVPGDGYLGRVQFAPCGAAMDEWRCIIGHAVSSLAGSVAQRRAAPWSMSETSPKADIGFGKICSILLGSSDASRDALTAFFQAEAETLVDRLWWEVGSFANSLLQHGTLEGDTINQAFAPIDDMQRRVDEGIRQARAAAASEGIAA